MRILVGVDGSDAAATALRWAGRLAGAVGAEVVVATSFTPDQAELDPDRYRELEEASRRRLDTDWSLPLVGTGVAHRSLELTGSPDALLEAADAEDADLIVVGPRSHGPVAGLHIGSLSHHLAHYTVRPLAMVPATGAEPSFERIVLGVDGSEGSAHAVRWCAAMAPALGADIVAVYAFEPIVEWVPETDPRSWRPRVERKLDEEWVAPLRDAGLNVRTQLIEDIHPVAALAGVISEERAGLAVLGTRGIGGFLGLRLGRVPIQLVHHTQIPVMVVPPPLDRAG